MQMISDAITAGSLEAIGKRTPRLTNVQSLEHARPSGPNRAERRKMQALERKGERIGRKAIAAYQAKEPA